MILGYLNPNHLIGGALKLNAAKARRVFAAGIAEPMDLAIEEAAYGAHEIAASNMIRAIKAVSTERGRDPREFALFAFGGNGPCSPCGMARSLGISRVIVPPAPGLFSSFGLLYADVEHHYSRTFRRLLRSGDLAEIDAAWQDLSRQALAQLEAEGFKGKDARLRRSGAMHYQGQSFELIVPVPDGPSMPTWSRIWRRHSASEHEITYGHRAGPDEPVELVSIQVVGQGLREGSAVPRGVLPRHSETESAPPRRAFFGAEHGWIETPIVDRSDLATRRAGPLIVEEYDATCLVPPEQLPSSTPPATSSSTSREAVARWGKLDEGTEGVPSSRCD